MKELYSNCKLNGDSAVIAEFMKHFTGNSRVYAPKVNVPDEDLVMLGYVDAVTKQMLIIQVSRNNELKYDIKMFSHTKVTNTFNTHESTERVVAVVHSLLSVKNMKSVTNKHCDILFNNTPVLPGLYLLHDGKYITQQKGTHTYRFKTPISGRKNCEDTFNFTDDVAGLITKLQQLKEANAYDKYVIEGDTLHCSIDRVVNDVIIREVKLPNDETAIMIADLLQKSISGQRMIGALTLYVHPSTAKTLSTCFAGKKVTVEKRYQAYKLLGES